MESLSTMNLAPLAVQVSTKSRWIETAIKAYTEAASKFEQRKMLLVCSGALAAGVLAIAVGIPVWLSTAAAIALGIYGFKRAGSLGPSNDLRVIGEALMIHFDAEQIRTLAAIAGDVAAKQPDFAPGDGNQWLADARNQLASGALDEYAFVATVCAHCPAAWQLTCARVYQQHLDNSAAFIAAAQSKTQG